MVNYKASFVQIYIFHRIILRLRPDHLHLEIPGLFALFDRFDELFALRLHLYILNQKLDLFVCIFNCRLRDVLFDQSSPPKIELRSEDVDVYINQFFGVLLDKQSEFTDVVSQLAC